MGLDMGVYTQGIPLSLPGCRGTPEAKQPGKTRGKPRVISLLCPLPPGIMSFHPSARLLLDLMVQFFCMGPTTKWPRTRVPRFIVLPQWPPMDMAPIFRKTWHAGMGPIHLPSLTHTHSANRPPCRAGSRGKECIHANIASMQTHHASRQTLSMQYDSDSGDGIHNAVIARHGTVTVMRQ